ncbi:hypothetical protein Tco_1365761, partial [Tanacetum coccineum]
KPSVSALKESSIDSSFALVNLFLAVFAKNLLIIGIRLNQRLLEESILGMRKRSILLFQEDENNVSFSGVVLGVEEESMQVYDTDIEDVIEEEQ